MHRRCRRRGGVCREALKTLAVAIALGVVALCVVASPVVAQAPDASIFLPDCERPFGGERFRRILALELSLTNVDSLEIHVVPEGVDPPPTEADLRVRIEAACESGRAVISVSGADDRPSVHQVLDLSDVDPTTRARAMAVAVAEQVRLQRLLQERAVEARAEAEAQSSEPPAAPSASSVLTPHRAAPPIAPATASPAPATVPSATASPATVPSATVPRAAGSVWFAIEGRGFVEQDTWPLGLRLGASFLILPLRIGFDAGVAFASAGHSSGRVELWLLTVGLSIGARWSPLPELSLTPALRADIGYVALTGYPDDGSEARQAQGASVAVVASLRVEGRVADHLTLLADIDVGPTLLGNVARAGDVAVAGVSGLALALRAGFAYRF